MADAFQGIVGKELVGIAVEQGGDRLILAFMDGSYRCVAVEGDCCSHSYWHEILGAKGCYGGVVTTVRELEMSKVLDPEYGAMDEDIKAYGYAVDTTLGSVRFVFRNESNGYYGGWACDEDGDKTFSDWTYVDSNDWTA